MHDQTAQGESETVNGYCPVLQGALRRMQMLFENDSSVSLLSKEKEEYVRAAMASQCVATLGISIFVNEHVRSSVRDMYDSDIAGKPGTFDALLIDQQNGYFRDYTSKCHYHLANTFIEGGYSAVTKYMEKHHSDVLSAAVKENQSLRLTIDLSKVLRALDKDMSSGAETYDHCEGDKFVAYAG